MKNPFIKISPSGREYTDSSCSINRVPIAKLPIYGIEDELEGKTAMEIFSTRVIAEEIRSDARSSGISTADVSDRKAVAGLVKKLAEGDPGAMETARKFGRRLGIIFLTLKLGESENREARKDWNDDCWEYWKNVKHVILVGGLMSGVLGAVLKAEADSIFEAAGVEPYDFILFDNATYIGIMGGASQIRSDDGVFVVFDFGQTNLKRSVVTKRGGETAEIKMLDSLPSKYMQPMTANDGSAREEAERLNLYLRSCIFKTIKSVEILENVGDEVVISIANYVCDGKLHSDRAGYAKLCAICDNYAEYLENELSGMLRRKIKICLLHDSTAAALYFKDYKDAVCITAGTAFGVGFPDIEL